MAIRTSDELLAKIRERAGVEAEAVGMSPEAYQMQQYIRMAASHPEIMRIPDMFEALKSTTSEYLSSAERDAAMAYSQNGDALWKSVEDAFDGTCVPAEITCPHCRRKFRP